MSLRKHDEPASAAPTATGAVLRSMIGTPQIRRAGRVNVTPAVRHAAFGALGVIVLSHLAALSGTITDAPTLGLGFVVVITAAVWSAAQVLRDRSVGWIVGCAVAVVAVTAYIISRTVGLPLEGGKFDNWFDPLGVVAAVAEGIVIALGAVMIHRQRAIPIRGGAFKPRPSTHRHFNGAQR